MFTTTTLGVSEGSLPVLRRLKIRKCCWGVVCRDAVGQPAAVWVGIAAFCCQLSLMAGKLLFQQLHLGVSFDLDNKYSFFNQPKIQHCNTQILQIPEPGKEMYSVIAGLVLLLSVYCSSTFCFIHMEKSPCSIASSYLLKNRSTKTQSQTATNTSQKMSC